VTQNEEKKVIGTVRGLRVGRQKIREKGKGGGISAKNGGWFMEGSVGEGVPPVGAYCYVKGKRKSGVFMEGGSEKVPST